MIYLKRKFARLIAKFFSTLLELSQRFGVSILLHHYYSEIPDLRELKNETYWKLPKTMIGINGIDIESQLNFVKLCCNTNDIERVTKEDLYLKACLENNQSGFTKIDSDFLYCFIRTIKPKKIIQVGAGISTSVILHANKESTYNLEITCIEPNPSNFLKMSHANRNIKLIIEKAQKLPLSQFTNLDDGDLLFVDSSHAVKPGGEVNLIILEVLPRLKKGTYVLFHDIFFPYDYKRNLLTDCIFFNNESVLLHAFLIDNSKYTIKASLSMLHYAKPIELQDVFPNYCPQKNDYGLKTSIDPPTHFPTSAYIQAIK